MVLYTLSRLCFKGLTVCWVMQVVHVYGQWVSNVIVIKNLLYSRSCTHLNRCAHRIRVLNTLLNVLARS